MSDPIHECIVELDGLLASQRLGVEAHYRMLAVVAKLRHASQDRDPRGSSSSPAEEAPVHAPLPSPGVTQAIDTLSQVEGELRSAADLIFHHGGAAMSEPIWILCEGSSCPTHVVTTFGLLFADVNMEHPDNYRFLREASEWVGGELVTLDNDGKTIWDVFREGRFLGNSRVDLCSRVLKREPMRRWLEAECDPTDTVVHLGFDISEPHRLPRAQPHWEPWRVEAPLLWEPVVWKDQALDTLRDAGIEPPLLTRMGWPHANCGGGCVKAGIGQFRKLAREMPDTFAEWERNEAAIAEHLGKPVAILRDRRGGTSTPIPLSTLRKRIETENEESLLALLDADPGDSCNCMGGEV